MTEQMKISSIVKSYPNSFIVALATKRDNSNRVELASILGIHTTKEEAIVQQAVLELVGVRTILVPTFEDTENALSVKISEDRYDAEPLLSPAENAKIFRDYWNL